MIEYAMYHALFLGAYLVIKFLISVSFSGASFLALLMTFFIPKIVLFIQKKYKTKKLSEQKNVSYKELLALGTYLFLFASLILSLPQYIYYQYINVDFLTNAYNQSLEFLTETFKTNEDFVKKIETQEMPSPVSMVFNSLLLNVFLGFLLSLLTSFFVNKVKVK